MEPPSEAAFFTFQRPALSLRHERFFTATSHALGLYFTNHRQRTSPSKVTHLISPAQQSTSLPDKFRTFPKHSFGGELLASGPSHLCSVLTPSRVHFQILPDYHRHERKAVAPGIITGTRAEALGAGAAAGMNQPSIETAGAKRRQRRRQGETSAARQGARVENKMAER